ncbi:MAG: CDP-glycerol glycerophosphotransferase family protein [Microthrixaceae bacterium]
MEWRRTVTTNRPRVLIPITIHFAVRYVVRTGLLDRIREVCEPVLALTWDDPDLVTDLSADGTEVLRLPDPLVEAPIRQAVAVLNANFTYRLASPSTRIDHRRQYVDRPMRIRLRRELSRWRTNTAALRPGAEEAARQSLRSLLATESNLAAYLDVLDRHRIDSVLSVTPFVSQEFVLLHAAASRGLPLICSVLSFDNVTTRPPFPVRFDRYLVWNRFNREELLRGVDGLNPADIAVVGPAQFDFYARPELVDERAAWCAALDVPVDAPTVLYGAGPPTVAPHEMQYVDHLLAGIADRRLPADLVVVLRRHPTDRPERWERFGDHPSVRFDDPGAIGSDVRRPGQTNLDDRQIRHLCTTLAHTDVHVNVSSTMTLDGACFDKPQIGPAYDVDGVRRHRRRAEDLYRREHFVAIVGSGGLELSGGPAELVSQVRSALDEPGRLSTRRRAMLEAVCTYTDGRCTERVADEVTRFIADRAVTRILPGSRDRSG